MFRYLVKSNSSNETQALAFRIAGQLVPGDVLAMSGDLASGKTTFTQGLTAYFEVEEYTLSPTFTYINEYHGKTQDIIHIDAYRLNRGDELVGMGIWDYFESGAIVVIEWADIVAEAIPEGTIGLSFRHSEGGDSMREILIDSPRELSI